MAAKEKVYAALENSGGIKEEDKRPKIEGYKPILGALIELSTERNNGMGFGPIPVSKVWLYLERFNLPDWWEPILLQSDQMIVSSMNQESGDGKKKKHPTPKYDNVQGLGKGGAAVRSG